MLSTVLALKVRVQLKADSTKLAEITNAVVAAKNPVSGLVLHPPTTFQSKSTSSGRAWTWDSVDCFGVRCFKWRKEDLSQIRLKRIVVFKVRELVVARDLFLASVATSRNDVLVTVKLLFEVALRQRSASAPAVLKKCIRGFPPCIRRIFDVANLQVAATEF
jgi:hypothetical protein